MAHDPLLESALNLSRFHREHEKYYSAAPLEDAVVLQRTSLALMALAERWSQVEPGDRSAASPFAGAEDLNDERAVELAGILFMEGEGEPAEIARIKRDLRTEAASHETGSAWLAAAMEAVLGPRGAARALPAAGGPPRRSATGSSPTTGSPQSFSG